MTILDEIDGVKDLDDLIYTLTRINSDIKAGGVTIIGISNRVSFKESLDPRSLSTLYEIGAGVPSLLCNGTLRDNKGQDVGGLQEQCA